MKYCKIFPVLLCILSLLGCMKNKSSDLLTGKWRAVLSTSGGDLPFFFEINKNKEKLTAQLLNGYEKVNVNDITIKNDSITLYLPAFNSTIKAKFDDSSMLGNLTLIKAGGVKQIIPFIAQRNQDHKFFKESKSLINITGRWEVEFVDEDGSSYPAVGEFIQKGSKLNGTFLTTTGDYRYLDGQVSDSVLYLSTFDGAHAFLFKAVLDNNGKLDGWFWSGLTYHEKWTALRNEKAKLPDPDSLTFLKEGYHRLDFKFPDLNGDTISLSDDKYKDKVVIVTLAGSWCPNCHDEARFLSPFFDRYHYKGLEIIGLMYENYNEPEKAIDQIRKFRDKFNIQYDLLYAGINNKDFAGRTIPQLNKVLAFPTTIFIDRKGRVRRINTGFSGPGTGEHYGKLTEDLTRFVEKLLNEK